MKSPSQAISQGDRMFVIFGTDNPTNTAHPPGPLGFASRTIIAGRSAALVVRAGGLYLKYECGVTPRAFLNMEVKALAVP
jgi:hypothetical protein